MKLKVQIQYHKVNWRLNFGKCQWQLIESAFTDNGTWASDLVLGGITLDAIPVGLTEERREAFQVCVVGKFGKPLPKEAFKWKSDSY